MRVFAAILFLCVYGGLRGQFQEFYLESLYAGDTLYTSQQIEKHKIKTIYYKKENTVSDQTDYSEDYIQSTRKFNQNGQPLTIVINQYWDAFGGMINNKMAHFTYSPTAQLMKYKQTETAIAPTFQAYLIEHDLVYKKVGDKSYAQYIKHENVDGIIKSDTIKYWYDLNGKHIGTKQDNDSTYYCEQPECLEKIVHFKNGKVSSKKIYDSKNQVETHYRFWEGGMRFIQTYYEEDSLILYKIEYNTEDSARNYYTIDKHIRDSTGTLLKIERYRPTQAPTDSSLEKILEISTLRRSSEQMKCEFYPNGKVKYEWGKSEYFKRYFDLLNYYEYWGDSILRWSYKDSALTSFNITHKGQLQINNIWLEEYENPSQKIFYPNGILKFERIYDDSDERDWIEVEYSTDGDTLQLNICEHDKEEEETYMQVYYDSKHRRKKEKITINDTATYLNTYKYNANGFLINEVNNH